MKIIGKDSTKIWFSPKRYCLIDRGFRKYYYIIIDDVRTDHRKTGPAYIDSVAMEWNFHYELHRSDGPSCFLKGKETLWYFKNDIFCEEKYWNM